MDADGFEMRRTNVRVSSGMSLSLSQGREHTHALAIEGVGKRARRSLGETSFAEIVREFCRPSRRAKLRNINDATWTA